MHVQNLQFMDPSIFVLAAICFLLVCALLVVVAAQAKSNRELTVLLVAVVNKEAALAVSAKRPTPSEDYEAPVHSVRNGKPVQNPWSEEYAKDMIGADT